VGCVELNVDRPGHVTYASVHWSGSSPGARRPKRSCHVDEQLPGSGQPTPVTITAVIGTDAASLSRMALDVAPARAADLGGTQDAVVAAVRRRLARYAPELT
jgi:hypothetical protein